MKMTKSLKPVLAGLPMPERKKKKPYGEMSPNERKQYDHEELLQEIEEAHEALLDAMDYYIMLKGKLHA